MNIAVKPVLSNAPSNIIKKKPELHSNSWGVKIIIRDDKGMSSKHLSWQSAKEGGNFSSMQTILSTFSGMLNTIF